MEQTKALNALEPFLALTKSATSPRAAADLITRATSAPNTYVFAELLQTPQIRALATDADYAPYLQLLRIFSYGTYLNYQMAQSLPSLSEAQTLKLRQLTLMSIAPDRSKLSYQALQRYLGLGSVREVENVVITAIYAGLVDATLDPARKVVQVSRIAPLRDLRPSSIPELSNALRGWGDRCTGALEDLEAQIRLIRNDASARESQDLAEKDKLAKLVGMSRDKDEPKQRNGDLLSVGRNPGKQAVGKPGLSPLMDLDEEGTLEDGKRLASKRKM